MSDALWKVNLRQRLMKLLNRNRLTLPCPIPFTDVYKSAFPGSVQIQVMCRPNAAQDAMKDMQKANIMRCVTTSQLVSFTIENPADDVDEPRMFWMKVPWGQPVIAPPLGATLFISAALRTDKRLLDWLAACEKMDEKIEKYTFRIYEFARLVDNANERDGVWPELVNWVQDDPPAPKLGTPMAKHRLHRINTLRQNFTFIMDPDTKHDLEGMLATASLLPDEKPLSWAGDPTLEKL